MKKYLKELTIRIIIFILILVLPLILIELILSNLDIGNKWYIEDININEMNKQKLKSYKLMDNGLWLHKNEELADKKEGIKRILIVGDSYIWGHGYSNANHTWWQQFKHMLKEEGYENIEVIAAGVSGYSTKKELEYILKDKDMIQKVNPDLIILGYVNNDTEIDGVNDNAFLEYQDINMYRKYKSLEFLKLTLPNIYRKIGDLLINKYENDEHFQSIFGLNYYNWLREITSDENLKYYENNVLKELDNYIRNEIKVPYIYYYTTADINEPRKE